MFLKRLFLLISIVFLFSCRFTALTDVTSSYDEETKIITVNVNFPEGAYAWVCYKSHLSTRTDKTLKNCNNQYVITSIDDAVIMHAHGTSGIIFKGWEGIDIADVSKNRTAVMLTDKNRTITANFIEETNPSNITIKTVTEGLGSINITGTVAKEKHSYRGAIYVSSIPALQSKNIEAVPNAGYTFSHWKSEYVADVSNASTSITPPKKNITLTAVFKPK